MNEFKLTAAFFGHCRKLTTIDLTNTNISDEQLEQLQADLNNKMPKAAITIKKSDQEYKTDALLTREAIDRIQKSGQQTNPTQLTITNDLLQATAKVGDSEFTVNLLKAFDLSHAENTSAENFNRVQSLVFESYTGADIYCIYNVPKHLSNVTFSGEFSNLFYLYNDDDDKYAPIENLPDTVTSLQLPSNIFTTRVEADDGHHTKFEIPRNLSNLKTISFAPNTKMDGFQLTPDFFKNCPKLIMIDLTNTNISKTQIQELQKQFNDERPGVAITILHKEQVLKDKRIYFVNLAIEHYEKQLTTARIGPCLSINKNLGTILFPEESISSIPGFEMYVTSAKSHFTDDRLSDADKNLLFEKTKLTNEVNIWVGNILERPEIQAEQD
jgi:predicted Fe-Mo cluster-binding NifX family protein